MSWYQVYQAEDGRAISGTSDPTKIAVLSVLNARGYAVKQFPDGAQNGVWNQSTLQFDPAPAAQVLIGADQFLNQFNAPEVQKIFASADARIIKLRILLQMRQNPINLLGQVVQQALTLIAALGLFDDQTGPGTATTRPDAILAYRPPAREL